MLWAVVAYTQDLNPLGFTLLSTLIAALPVLVLFYLLVVRGWLPSKAGAAGALTAIICAWVVYGMPLGMAAKSFVSGAAFGLVPIGWTVFSAMMVYNITVVTGQFNKIRRSVSSLSNDARIQAILIGFCFGAFLEGAAGAGSPVAICGAMLVGLGFPPVRAAVLCLIANTSPVAYGGLGVPILTLAATSNIPVERISIMAGHQLPILSCLVPTYMVLLMCGWRKTLEVWPVLVVGGGSFAAFQFVFATAHNYVPGLILYPMTDIGGGIFSLIITAIFLRFWQPRTEWHFEDHVDGVAQRAANALEAPLSAGAIAMAWMPFIIMSVCLLLGGRLRQEEARRAEAKEAPIELVNGLKTKYEFAFDGLNKEVLRAERLRKAKLDDQGKPLKDANGKIVRDDAPEAAVFEFAWLSTPGTAVFVSGLLSMLLLRMTPRQIALVVRKTAVQMKVPIPTIACMLGLSYVTRYAGMDATLGVAFAGTGVLYPFFAAILGWMGVFLTGTDAGSNALFGSLQKITAGQVYTDYQAGAFSHLGRDQAEVLMCTANSTGGVMGKMIDAQSICVATAGTNQIGKEGEIFKTVVWHSVLLASLVGLLTLLQAYVPPFTLMVPKGP
jgi:L-lactate permease